MLDIVLSRSSLYTVNRIFNYNNRITTTYFHRFEPKYDTHKIILKYGATVLVDIQERGTIIICNAMYINFSYT